MNKTIGTSGAGISEYGYLYDPPNTQEGDECYLEWTNPPKWDYCSWAYTGQKCNNIRRRRILPGEGFEIVGLDEVPPIEGMGYEYFNGKEWLPFGNYAQRPVKDWFNDFWMIWNILAIRRPKQQPERVRYFKLADSTIYRTSNNPNGQLFSLGEWHNAGPPAIEDYRKEFGRDCEITPQQAADLVGNEAIYGTCPHCKRPLDKP